MYGMKYIAELRFADLYWEAPFRKFPGWIFCTNSCVNDRQVSAHVCPHMGTVGLRAINKLFDSTENKTQVCLFVCMYTGTTSM